MFQKLICQKVLCESNALHIVESQYWRYYYKQKDVINHGQMAIKIPDVIFLLYLKPVTFIVLYTYKRKPNGIGGTRHNVSRE